MQAFWKGKRVFITGHTGFKGSWLALWLVNMGAEVFGYSLESPFNPNLFEIAGLDKNITHIHSDIRNLDNLKKAINSFKPDIVFHLAAQSLVRTSYKYPVETFETNVMGTVNILEAIKSSDSVKVCVNITSDKCYENKESGKPFSETDPMGGYDPYSCSKGCAELVTTAYRKSFFKDRGIASARAGNVIGGGDWSEDRLIPDIARAISANQDVIIRNPHAVRPWQHVLEPLRGYLTLAQHLWKSPDEFSQGWNFGPMEESALSVEQLVKKVISIWRKGNYSVQKTDNLYESTLLMLDITKAQEKLKWYPAYDINDALSQTINWYKSFYNNEDMVVFSLNQIENYMKKVENISKNKLTVN